MKTSNLLWGTILVIVGVIFGLNALEITDINIFFDGWWTLFIIIPCFINVFKDNDKTGSIIGLIIGLCLLLSCQDIISFASFWKLLIPVVIVMVGLSMIFKDSINKKVRDEISKLNKSNLKEYYATFGGQDLVIDDEFSGCSLNAIFGGIKFNLKDASIKSEALINASAIFGGITIYVPNDVNVKITSTPIFGGVSDERKDKKKDCKKTIYINATSIFGGVEIK